MSRNNLPFKKAYSQVKSVKKDICPNEGFYKQLEDFNKELFKQ